ncbi:MAG: N-6 DNA methylase [Arcicella sp.]|jgi:type I restriction-modification system DNA methylase subunit/restriction endonuclease S subunit|nr:N-6 DNA methylase [Arcicella sp.]
MINKENFKDLLTTLNFSENSEIYSKHFPQGDFYLKVDFKNNKLLYPSQLKIGGEFTTNFSSPENFVVFECVHRLLDKGYKPEHIELEPKWKLGHGASGGRADIFITNQAGKPLLIIECKTFGKEFAKEWKDMQQDGGQLFTYIEQEKDVEFVCLYASSFDEKAQAILFDHRIISHRDNPQILADNPKLKTFKDAKNVKERYRVWKETYLLEFTEKGLFEENIQAYQIGKDKYTLDIDTKIIDATDKKGKYHQFRTILRKHNVSRRENAFEVLVNLFLCKIVDEKENKNDLKFYWKGIAYDNYFDLVDRLQSLYKTGMEQFLEQEIMYISDKQIDEIFWSFKQKRNIVKQTVKDYIKQLKFYKGLDFEFIKVHNKEKFDQNAKILLEIIQMWQGLRLKTAEQNQFLGDMFEFFLDNGIKQSEGQFFTPVPICKFIVMSLPLESQIETKNEPLKAIDYACGSGHFLTEYALQIKPLVQKLKNTEPTQYYRNTFGIEKEDRLAKVAKVSAFMYGLDEIQIIDADALMPNDKIKNEKFDVLVANPPFAVEDFLLTLEEEDRENYELFNTGLDLGNKNIQCFFLERAKQLLTAGGVAGIVVPSSILSNSDTMHVQTREILLKYFDFVSIVELGSGTFGKTGTNTVVLFLRRKTQRPEPAEHFWNRTQDFFENWADELKSGGGAYLDIDSVKRYCQHINIPFDDYQTFLLGKPSAELLKTEMFTDYRADFDGNAETANLKKKKNFRDLPTADQRAELNKRFIEYARSVEMDKLYFFLVADANGGENPQKVLLVKSPSDGKEQKAFLGYEWSGAKGSEGIKYNGGETVYDINTLLFDPNNPQNTSKINYLIQRNFQPNSNGEGWGGVIPENLQPFVSYANLTDLLDFSRKDFNKGFSLTPKKNTTIESKWELVKLENIMNISRGASPRPISKYITNDSNGVNWIKIGDVREGEKYITQTEEKITQEGASMSRYVNIGDFILSNSMSFGRPYIMKISGCVHDGWLLLTNFSEKLDKNFLFEILSYEDTQRQFSESAAGGVVQNLNTERVKVTKIPLPPLPIQAEIVKACEAVDLEVEKAKMLIEKGQMEIEDKVNSVNYKGYPVKKLNDLCTMQAGKFVPASEIKDVQSTDLYPCYGGNGLRGYTKSFTHEGKYSLIGRQGALCGNVHLVSGIFHATEHAVVVSPNLDIDVNWFYYQLKSLNLNQYATGTAQPGLSVKNVLAVTTPVPPLEIQQQLVTEIEQIEKRIADNQVIINQSSAKKQAVMKAYL